MGSTALVIAAVIGYIGTFASLIVAIMTIRKLHKESEKNKEVEITEKEKDKELIDSRLKTLEDQYETLKGLVTKVNSLEEQTDSNKKRLNTLEELLVPLAKGLKASLSGNEDEKKLAINELENALYTIAIPKE